MMMMMSEVYILIPLTPCVWIHIGRLYMVWFTHNIYCFTTFGFSIVLLWTHSVPRYICMVRTLHCVSLVWCIPNLHIFWFALLAWKINKNNHFIVSCKHSYTPYTKWLPINNFTIQQLSKGWNRHGWLTLWGQVKHICISKLSHPWFRFNAKPLPVPRMTFCELDCWEKTSVNYQLESF